MGIYRAALRASAATFLLAGSFVARPAAAQQVADLVVTFPAAPTSATKPGDVTSFGGFVPVSDKNGNPVAPTSLSFGKTIKYVFTVANNGPNHATGVAVNITPPAGTTVTAVSGATCKTDATTGNPDVTQSCAIAADMVNGATPVNVTVTVKLNVPKTAPATCPGGTALGTFTAVVVTDANTTDPNTTNNTATVSGAGVTFNAYTDVGLAITGFDDPKNSLSFGAVGGTVTYTVTVTNNGPCNAANVVVAPVPGNLLAFQSGTGPICTTAGEIANGCNPVDPMTPGQTVIFTNTYKISPLPSDVIQTTIPIEYDVTTDTTNVNADGGVETGGIRVGKEAGGCSSGGPAGLTAVALMALGALLARRRRA